MNTTNSVYMLTTLAPFDFCWERTKEINQLLNTGYVFPALTNAILLPDMFGYKYDEEDDGNTETERHYKGWCKKNFCLFEHPMGTKETDYNLLNPNLCYKIRNYIVHGTKITPDGKDDLNRLFRNKKSIVGKQFDDVEVKLLSGIFLETKKGIVEAQLNENNMTWISSIRQIENNKLFVGINAFVLCQKLIRAIDADYKESTEEERNRYNTNYLCNRQFIMNNMMEKRRDPS